MFTFNAYGNTLVVTAEDISCERAEQFADGISDLSTAMGIANSKLIWNSHSKEGIWTDVDVSERTFEWIEGYFYD